MAPRRLFSKMSDPMDQWLDSQGYYRKHTARDGSCLFRAVSEQLFLTQVFHEKVRRQCVDYMMKNRLQFEKEFNLSCSFDEYLHFMQNPKEWGGNLELLALAELYRLEIVIFEQIGSAPSNIMGRDIDKTIMLCCSDHSHYDSVYTKEFIEKAGFTQSLVYELLYKNVFKLPDVDYAVDRMLHKSSQIKRYRCLNNAIFPSGSLNIPLELSLGFQRLFEYDDEDDDDPVSFDVKGMLEFGITPFPYKVAKALDPDIYRNIEFDIWSDMKKEMRYGIFNSDLLQIGVRCLVKFQPNKTCHAYIQEMSSDKGPVLVFVEELGEKCTVPYENLEPLPKSQRPQIPCTFREQCLAALTHKTAVMAISENGGKWKKQKFHKNRKLQDTSFTLLQSDENGNEVPNKMSVAGENTLQSSFRGIYHVIDPYGHNNQAQSGSSENWNCSTSANNIGNNMIAGGTSRSLQQNKPSNQSDTNKNLSQTMTFQFPSHKCSYDSKEKQSENIKAKSPPSLPDSTSRISSNCPMVPMFSSQQTSCSNQQIIQIAGQSGTQYSLSPNSVDSTSGLANPFLFPNVFNFTSNPCLINNNAVCNENPVLSPSQMNNGMLKANEQSAELPLTDIPKLRFYYNLGYDMYHFGCIPWGSKNYNAHSGFVQFPQCSSGENGSVDYNATLVSQQQLPDSTTTGEEECHHTCVEAPQSTTNFHNTENDCMEVNNNWESNSMQYVKIENIEAVPQNEMHYHQTSAHVNSQGINGNMYHHSYNIPYVNAYLRNSDYQNSGLSQVSQNVPNNATSSQSYIATSQCCGSCCTVELDGSINCHSACPVASNQPVKDQNLERMDIPRTNVVYSQPLQSPNNMENAFVPPFTYYPYFFSNYMLSPSSVIPNPVMPSQTSVSGWIQTVPSINVPQQQQQFFSAPPNQHTTYM